MAVESTGAVGSWFCNSCASRLRKVVPSALPELLLEVELLLLVVFAVLAVLALAVKDVWSVLFGDALSVLKIVGMV